MDVRQVTVGPWPMNAYVLICPQTRQSALVDPGADPALLSAALEGTTPVAILLTHTHPDHVGALDDMRRRLSVPVMAYDGPHWQDMALQADRWLADGEQVALGNYRLRAIHTPGHIPDMLCYHVEETEHRLVGDTLFAGGPGRTWSAEDFRTTLRTLRQRILAWPDDSICYPGHGDPFRLGDIRPQIEAFLAREHGDFYGDATWDTGAA